MLPKGKLLEDDLNSTLNQFRKGPVVILVNDAEQHCGGVAVVTCFGGENFE